MREIFLSKSPNERYREMKLLLQEFQTRAERLNISFSLLVYGSGSYGVKRGQYGNLDDLDLFLIIPRYTDIQMFLASIKAVFQTTFDIKPKYLTEVLSGNWDICRMYGENDGIRLGFRILCSDTLELLSNKSRCDVSVKNIAKVGQSRIIVDYEWSIKEWQYIPCELLHQNIILENEVLLQVEHHVFTTNTERLGALGRKLLSSTVVYDPTKQTEQHIKNIWRIYVQACICHHPNISNSEIINSIMRSERFSSSFRKKLSNLISKIRK